MTTFCLTLWSCAEQDKSDLVDYVKEIKSQRGSKIPPLPEFMQHKMFSYNRDFIRDPFLPVVDVEVVTKTNYVGPRPDERRVKEPLESFSLDTLRMMGSINQKETNWVLIKDPDGLLHRLTIGNYLGLNNGKIITIADNSVEISEMIPDGNGWQKRKAGLEMAEE